VRTFFGQGRRGSSDADVRTFWHKNLGFFEKIMVCPHGQRGKGELVRTFSREVGSISREFVWTTFMDGP